ncbi:hypothetical protein ASO20_00380 [Mycoplasma sp. (ex Biomphalaria glabrata)]|uniref:hypothetical protein n=1 Tax=Mycoplasma sp. (ex Biomphalaria glabrata) TaxID=1749074 RepID=UPI00073A95E7|nr:hypothetical protein [Mycoplasma sp. (ex Biomphalaria glabrata)]ALV23138.1 hypothetical protein ASO20_00380 [Mycoplasma sp. (ex Biomphalaria glabrata)]
MKFFRGRKNSQNKNQASNIWGNTTIKESFETSSSFRKIYNHRIRINTMFRQIRLTFVVIFVILGTLALAGTSFIVVNSFNDQSFRQNFDKYYSKTEQVVLHFDNKPGNTTKLDKRTIVTDVQQQFNMLFTQKLIDPNVYSPRDLQVTAINDKEVSIQGPVGLMDQLITIYKSWTTTKNMSITDVVGDQITCGTGDPTTGWLANYYKWLTFHYKDNGTMWEKDASGVLAPFSLTDLQNQVSTFAEKDCSSMKDQVINSDLFSNASQSQLGKSNDYILTFQVSDTNKWEAFTSFLYDLMKPLQFNVYDFNGNPYYGTSTQNPDQDSNKNVVYNSSLHFYLFMWYGDAPMLQKNPSDPKDPGQDYFNLLFPRFTDYRLLEGIWNSTGVNAYNTFFSSNNHNYNQLQDWANSFNEANSKYRMTYNKDNKMWEPSKLFAIYTIDYASNFKGGLSASTINFDNKSDSASSTSLALNNFFYPIHKDYNSSDPKESSSATQDLSNAVRSSLGGVYWNILSINMQDPLLFDSAMLLIFLIGLGVFVVLSLGYLIWRYRWIGAFSGLGLIVFIMSMFVIFVIFKISFQPATLIIFLTGVILYIANALLMLKRITKPFVVPAEKTLFETMIERFKRIFYGMFEFNFLLFAVLYLSFNLVLGLFQGGALIVCAFLVSIFIVLSSFLLMGILSLIENFPHLRAQAQLLGIKAHTSSVSQVANVHYYPEKIFAEKEEQAARAHAEVNNLKMNTGGEQ